MKKAIVLGTFDGLHKGHLKVLDSCKESDIKTVLTFDYAPKYANKKYNNIMQPEIKNNILKKLGFKVEVLDFLKVKNLSKEEFLDIILQKFSPTQICCGYNYKFGKNALGDTNFIKEYLKNKVEIAITEEVIYNDKSVSSTLIRNLIKNGEIKKANELLYKNFCFKAVVLNGDKRGRTIGFPTINQKYPSVLVTPRFGVYLSSVFINNKKYKAITNIGVRPTFKTDDILAETHILDFEADLYGQEITVELLDFIRDEVRFNNINELKKAINKDIEKAFK